MATIEVRTLTSPVEKTMNLLANTPNQAAVGVLVAALESRQSNVKHSAIKALVHRRNVHGHSKILDRFHTFGPAEHAALHDALRDSPHHMRQTLHDALLSDRAELCESACRIILIGHLYELLPALVGVSENRNHRHSAQAAAALVQLAGQLQQEIAGESREKTCDPFFARRQAIPSLEQAITRYESHRRLEIIDAFLLLVPPLNSALSQILNDDRHPCHAPVMESLLTSSVTAISDLLAELLRDTQIPDAVLRIISQRHDRKYLDHLLHRVGTPLSLRVLENFKRLSSVVWLQQAKNVLTELDGSAQAAAVSLATASRMHDDDQLALLSLILTRGQPEGRRAACEALSRFEGRTADQCIRESLLDADPGVQAAAAKQVRRRRFPDAMERLVAMLEDPAPEVRNAARSSLGEFSFVRYQNNFDKLDDAARRSTGRLVLKVDLTAPRRLGELLNSPSHSTRLRGLEMVTYMDAGDAVLARLIDLMEDNDLAIRAEVATALSRCTSHAALGALDALLKDANHSVREAARVGIERFDRHSTTHAV